MKKRVPMVYVEFLDHCSKSEWMNAEQVQDFKAATCYALGFLMGEDENVYKVSCEITEDGDCGDTIAIIKKAVTKFKRLNIRV